MRYKHMSHQSSTISLDTKLRLLLLTRNTYLEKIKQIDGQILDELQKSFPSSNTECLQIIGTALSASILDLENTVIEFPRPNKPPIIIAPRNKVTLNFPGSTDLSAVNPSQSASSAVSTSQPASTNQQESRVETPTRNLEPFGELTSADISLEYLLSNINS